MKDKKPWYTTNAAQYAGLAILVLLSLLLFDLKVAIGGDDAEYMVAAKNFADGISFPGWHGAMYPILLSLFYKLFGFRIVLFKLFSLALIIFQFVFFYKTFKTRVPDIILVPVLFLLSVNYFILYNASQTSSEPLYLALQAAAFFYFFKMEDTNDTSLQRNWRNWLLLGLLAFLLSQTRNIGYSFVMATVMFLLFNKKFRNALYFTGSYFLFFILFNIYKHLVWERNSIGLEGQFNVMLYKDPYHYNYGYETFSGFVNRFLDNTNFYFSNAIIKLFGLRGIDDYHMSWAITILLMAVFVFAFYKSFKNNRYIFFVGLYTIIILGITFITQQARWAQARLMLIALPFFLLLFLYFFNHLKEGFKYSRHFVIIVSVILFLCSGGITLKGIKTNVPTLKKNMGNDPFYGYTPDYKHYVQACQWTGINIDKSKKIACRKPHIGAIYSNGGSFEGIYSITSYDINKVQGKYPNYFIIELNGYLKFMPYEDRFKLRDYFHCYLVGNSSCYVLASVPDTATTTYSGILSKLKIPYSTQFEDFRKELLTLDTKSFAEYPDSLLKEMKKRDLSYIIFANLRLNPLKNDGKTQSSAEGTVNYINTRYPGFLKPIINFGEGNDEPASVMQLNYDIIKKYNY